ncbi:MAG: hypothetical protein HYU62_00255 [Caulobacterales bacterium]|nr:hypothetical protein [Caulobacterales bacterium]
MASEPIRIRAPDYEAGALERSDDRANGRYQDRYILNGLAGDEIEIKASGDGFEVTAAIRGHGLQQASELNWLDESVIEVTLPRDGDYAVTVTASEAGTLGNYTLTVMERCESPNYLDANGECVAP